MMVDVARTAGGAWAGRFQAMASPCEVLIDGAECDELFELTRIAAVEALRIEAKWSRYRPGNIVHAINTANGQPVEVDVETARLIDFAALLHEISGGRFDLTSGVLRRAWRFAPGQTVPDPADIEALRPVVGWDKADWRSRRLRLAPGMEIDFGGLGKEYAVDRALALLSARTGKAVLLNFGGDLAASGPRADGMPWEVGIDSGVPHAATPIIRLSHGAVATSGDRHRHIASGGKRYGHILDPRTGWPPPDAPRSVTVASQTCVQAGALSTIALLHGIEAEGWLQAQGADFHVVR